jgi:hypothetical protein
LFYKLQWNRAAPIEKPAFARAVAAQARAGIELALALSERKKVKQ